MNGRMALMRISYLFGLQFLLLVVVALAFNAANYLYDYTQTFLIYSPVHFLGGMWVGALVLWFFKSAGFKTELPLLVASLLFVVLVWEMWEAIIDAVHPGVYIIDTVSDILFDIAGGITTYLWVKNANEL